METNTLIASVDGGIGSALQRATGGDGTSRESKGQYYLDILKDHTFPVTRRYDRLWFTIGINSKPPLDRLNVFRTNAIKAYDFLNWAGEHLLNPGARVMVITSQWGSIAEVNSARDYPYRMSKAALNMGVAILQEKYQQHTWMCMHPGLVVTKLTTGIEFPDPNRITPEVSVAGMLQVSESVSSFGFYSYTGRTIPW